MWPFKRKSLSGSTENSASRLNLTGSSRKSISGSSTPIASGAVQHHGKIENLDVITFRGPQVPYDYWVPVRSHLDHIFGFERIEAPLSMQANALKSIVSAVDSIAKYVCLTHHCHQNAIKVLKNHSESGVPFALYLRNFMYSGGTKIVLGPDGPQRKIGARASGHDANFIPALQRALGETQLVYLSNPYMFSLSETWEDLANTNGFRAHTHNWKKVVGEFVDRAQMIVLFGEKHIRSVEFEMDLLEERGRLQDTLGIVRFTSKSIDADRFIERLPNSILFEEFVATGFRDFANQEAHEEYNRRFGLKRIAGDMMRILPDGVSALQLLAQRPRAPEAKRPTIWEERCFLNGRDFIVPTGDSRVDAVDLNSKDSIVIAERLFDRLADLDALANITLEQNDELVAQMKASIPNRKSFVELSQSNFVNAVKWYAAAAELECYDKMSDALLIANSRAPTLFQEDLLDSDGLGVLLRALTATEGVTGYLRNTDRLHEALKMTYR